MDADSDNYGGFAPCGCMLIVTSMQVPQEELAKTVAQMVRKRLRVETVKTSFVRSGKFTMGCEQCCPKRFAKRKAEAAQTPLFTPQPDAPG